MSQTNPQKVCKEKPGILYTDIGSPIMPVYERVYDEKTGKSLVVKTDEFDIDEFIQASNCKTDLAMLRAEMIATGQLPVIDKDVVVDATLMPENIHEVFNAVNNVAAVFNGLPESVKSLFTDKDDFMQSLINNTYQQRVLGGLANAGQNIQEEKTQTKTEEKEGQ